MLLPTFSLRRFRPFILTALVLLAPSAAVPFSRAETSEASNFSRRVVEEMNRLRSNPAAYAASMERERTFYTANRRLDRPGEIPLLTHEGVAALDDAIRALRNAPPVPPLAWSRELSAAAGDHAAEQSRTGGTGHAGIGGETPGMRISRHGTWLDCMGEDIAYNAPTPERVVYNLVVDDGLPSRGHRAAILNPGYHVAGAAMGSHPQFRTMCVIDFAGGFISR